MKPPKEDRQYGDNDPNHRRVDQFFQNSFHGNSLVDVRTASSKVYLLILSAFEVSLAALKMLFVFSDKIFCWSGQIMVTSGFGSELRHFQELARRLL